MRIDKLQAIVKINPNAQGKLVRCVSGEIYDVVVDIRRQSPTFSTWVATKLNNIEHHQLWIPSGFAHGFCSLEKENYIIYNCTNYRHKKSEVGIKYNDKKLNIKWPVKKPILSNKDKKNLTFIEFKKKYKK